jgi:hypothetical protein
MLGWFGGYGFQGTQSDSSENNKKLQFPNCRGAFSLIEYPAMAFRRRERHNQMDVF